MTGSVTASSGGADKNRRNGDGAGGTREPRPASNRQHGSE